MVWNYRIERMRWKHEDSSRTRSFLLVEATRQRALPRASQLPCSSGSSRVLEGSSTAIIVKPHYRGLVQMFVLSIGKGANAKPSLLALALH